MFSTHVDEVENYIAYRTLRSIAVTLDPRDMQAGSTAVSNNATNEQLLSLLEAEHEALTRLVARLSAAPPYPGAVPDWLQRVYNAPEDFRNEVNKILEAHAVAFYLHHNSRLVEVESHEMHDAVVAPTLYLLHRQPRFAAAEAAYQKALAELRDRDAGDAITDAATALQDVLTALGCTGGALGDLLNSAKKNGLVKGNDTPLTDVVGRTVSWVAAKRNQGEAHRGDSEIDMSDAWMLVHVVGALIIRLTEQNGVQ